MTNLQYPKALNLKAVILWGIIIGLVAFGLYTYREPLVALISSIPSRIGNFQIPNFTGFFNGIIDYINKNPIAVIATAASLCTAAITILSKIHANKEKALALEEKAQTEQLAGQSVISAQQEALKYKTQLEELTKNNMSNTLQEALSESQNLVSSQQTQLTSLKGQIEALQNQLLLKDTKVIEKTVVK